MNPRRPRPWRTPNLQARVVADLIEESALLEATADGLEAMMPATPPALPPPESAPVEAAESAPPPPPPDPEQHRAARDAVERAGLLEQAGDRDGALAQVDRALEHDPEYPPLLVRRAALLCALRRYAAAERDLRKVLRDAPADAGALAQLGLLLSRKGLWSQAVPQLRHAVEADPGLAAAWYYLGEALNHVDDLAGALDAYQRAAALEPQNPKPLYGQGIVLDRLNRPEDAKQVYRRSREVARR